MTVGLNNSKPDPPTPPSRPNNHIVIINEDDESINPKYILAIRLSKTIKFFTFIDIFFLIFYFLLQPLYALAIIICLLGYYGAKKFNHCLIGCYLTYNIFSVIFRIFIWGFYLSRMNLYNTQYESFMNVFFTLCLMFFNILIELYIIRILWYFCKIIKSFNQEDYNEVLKLDKLLKVQFGCF